MKSQNSNSMDNSEFREFFIEQIKDIYWAEKHFHKTLQKLQRAASSESLIYAFDNEIADTMQHIESVEKVFELMGVLPQEKKCDAMEGLIKEAQEIIDDTETDSFIRDAALILATQKALHYEIAVYGTLRVFAGHMDENKIRRHLEKILENKKETDAELTEVAEEYINELAVEE